jgi:hypothetical protein
MRNREGNGNYEASSADKSLKEHSQPRDPDSASSGSITQLKRNSNKIFKVFGINYASSQTALFILRKFAEGESQSVIASKAPFSISVINYWASKFLKADLIREKGHGKPRIFELTAFGQKFLTRCERGFCEPTVMEDYPLKFRLLQDAGRVNWVKLGQPNNWVKMGFKVSGIRVEKNCGDQPTVIIHTGQLSGFDPDALFLEAGTIVGLVRARLLDLGVVTDEVGFPIRRKWFKDYTPEAEILIRSGTVETQDGHIDASPPDNDAHEERGYEQQKNYMAIPRRIQQQSQDIADLKQKVSHDLADLKEIVSGLVNVVSGLVVADQAVTTSIQTVGNDITAVLRELSAPRPRPSQDRSVV